MKEFRVTKRKLSMIVLVAVIVLFVLPFIGGMILFATTH